MLRADIETMMKAKGMDDIILVPHKDDARGILCRLKGGILYKCTDDRRYDRKIDTWGYIEYKDGKPYRYAFGGEQ